MKIERLNLGCNNLIEAVRDQNGLYFIALYKNSSRFFQDYKEMRKWLQLAAKTPSRERFDAWIESLGCVDTGRAPEESDPTKDTKTII
jgi:hypothetical protein